MESNNLESTADDPVPEEPEQKEEEFRVEKASFCGGDGNPTHAAALQNGEDSNVSDELPKTKTTRDVENMDSSTMEDLIDKILEKYGESSTRETQKTANQLPDERNTRDEVKAGRNEEQENNDIEKNIRAWESSQTSDDDSGIKRWSERFVPERQHASSFRQDIDEQEKIGSVISSQKGVSQQLTTVSEGLDEMDAELERMKKDLERVQMNAYACQLSSQFGGETLRNIEVEKVNDFDSGDTQKYVKRSDRYQRDRISEVSPRNAWLEEIADLVKAKDRNQRTSDLNYKSTETRFSSNDWLGKRDVLEDSDLFQRSNEFLAAGRSTYQKSNEYQPTSSSMYQRTSDFQPSRSSVYNISNDFQPSGNSVYTRSSDFQPSSSKVYQRSNEWEEEREGFVKIGDGNDDLDRYLKVTQPVSYLPSAGRSYTRQSDVQTTNLLTTPDPVWRAGITTYGSTGLSTDRYRRPVISPTVDTTLKDSHNISKKDGYSYMCEDFGNEGNYTRHSSHWTDPSSTKDPVFQGLGYRRSVEPQYRAYSVSREPPSIHRSTSYVDVSNYDSGRTSNYLDVNKAFDRGSVSRSFARSASVSRAYDQQSQPFASTNPSTTSQQLKYRPTSTNTEFTSRFLTKVRRRNSLAGRNSLDRESSYVRSS